MRISNLVFLAPPLLRLTVAVPGIEPLPTPQGYLFYAGVSPRPTEAPGLNGIPKELVRREQDVIYPPPPSWCGFINGDYDNPLTCKSPYTCVNSNSAVGCCPNTLPGCTNIFTNCKDYGDYCDASCVRDDKLLKCSDSAMGYCGTYLFSGGTRLYNCETTSAYRSSVQFLSDHYLTAISSTLAPSTDPFGFSRESATASTTRSSSNYSYTSSSDGGGLSAEAIRGIAIGVSIGVCLIFILAAIFIVRRRRANRMKRAAQPNLPPAYSPNAPMQQQQSPSSNPSYQPVPQQDQSYPPPQTAYLSPGAVGKENETTVTSQPIGSPPTQTLQQRHSNAPSSFLSPNSSDPGRDSFYRPNGPVSPTITEVDGSDRPLPEADSTPRPMSTHQGIVSPMQQYGNPQQQQQGQGQRPIQHGYVPPRLGTHEVAPTQAYAGPYEMPDQRH